MIPSNYQDQVYLSLTPSDPPWPKVVGTHTQKKCPGGNSLTGADPQKQQDYIGEWKAGGHYISILGTLAWLLAGTESTPGEVPFNSSGRAAVIKLLIKSMKVK